MRQKLCYHISSRTAIPDNYSQSFWREVSVLCFKVASLRVRGPKIFMGTLFFVGPTGYPEYCDSRSTTHVHSIEQKSFGLKFSKSRSGSDVRYGCHHNSSRFTSPIFAHSWRFSVFHSLQSITPLIY